jgi:predicted GIY-YIG superfamily endonuclease
VQILHFSPDCPSPDLQPDCPEFNALPGLASGIAHGFLSAVPYYVYILRCSDDSFYVGSTTDLSFRLMRHHEGIGSSYTARRRPVVLAHSEEYVSRTSAVARERQLKRWTHQKKDALVRRETQELPHWSVRERKRRR